MVFSVLVYQNSSVICDVLRLNILRDLSYECVWPRLSSTMALNMSVLKYCYNVANDEYSTGQLGGQDTKGVLLKK